MLSSWFIYLVVGKVLIYVWQQFPLPEFIGRFEKINKLHTCGLCAGVWIFTVLAFFGMNILQPLGFNLYIPVVTQIITGIVSSFIVYVFEGGYIYRFGTIQIK